MIQSRNIHYVLLEQVQLYEEPEKPSNALQYLQNKFTGRETMALELEARTKENEQLKEKVIDDTRISRLTSKKISNFFSLNVSRTPLWRRSWRS